MPGFRSLAPASNPSSSLTFAPPPESQTQWDDNLPLLAPPAFRPPLLPLAFRQSLQPSLHASAQTIRPRQVTDPLTETVRAKLYSTGMDGERTTPNYGSSGSAHDPSTVCLAAMVHEFMEDAQVASCGRVRCNCVNGTCSGDQGGCPTSDPDDDPGDQSCEILEGFTSSTGPTELALLADVAKAVNAAKENADSVCSSEGVNCSNGCLLRWVMKHLRLAGHNAAVCKSRWEHAGGFPAGDYEYIDVIMEGRKSKTDRLIVDTDFRAQFEIARASSEYNALLQIVPYIFVGKPERLQQILKIMSDAAKRSLKKKGMHLPPWRKHWYLQAKWFSAYKRTTKEATHAHRDMDETLSREFASIALKGSQFCNKFKDEMENFYQSGREGQKGTGGNQNAASSDRELHKGALKRERSALVRADRGTTILAATTASASRDGHEITVMSTDWQLPALKPRNGGRAGGGVSGLANALKEAGLSSNASSAISRRPNICKRTDQQKAQKLRLEAAAAAVAC